MSARTMARIVRRFATAMAAPTPTEKPVFASCVPSAATVKIAPSTAAAFTDVAMSSRSVFSFSGFVIFVLVTPGIFPALERFFALDVLRHLLGRAEERAEAGVATDDEPDERDPLRIELLVEPSAAVIADGDRQEQLQTERSVTSVPLETLRRHGSPLHMAPHGTRVKSGVSSRLMRASPFLFASSF